LIALSGDLDRESLFESVNPDLSDPPIDAPIKE
jgi:hypothetical protein